MQFRIERPTRLAPDALFAWWIDFREGGHDHAFLGKRVNAQRHILSRENGKWEMEERASWWGLPFRERYIVTLAPARHEVLIQGTNTFSHFFATYRFEEGRAVLESTIAPTGLARLGVGVNRLVARRLLVHDLEGHLREAERDLA
ncbi:MAG: hypothetical protein ACYDCK_15275 [Thermoplasmatota archaeon]